MKKKLIGTWKLKSFLIENGGHQKEWRKGAHGLLIYSKEGYMSVSINSNAEENENILDSMIFYAGKFEVSDNKIRHYVTNATDILRINKIMERDINLQEDFLNIIADGEYGSAILKWEKIKL